MAYFDVYESILSAIEQKAMDSIELCGDNDNWKAKLKDMAKLAVESKDGINAIKKVKLPQSELRELHHLFSIAAGHLYLLSSGPRNFEFLLDTYECQ